LSSLFFIAVLSIPFFIRYRFVILCGSNKATEQCVCSDDETIKNCSAVRCRFDVYHKPTASEGCQTDLSAVEKGIISPETHIRRIKGGVCHPELSEKSFRMT